MDYETLKAEAADAAGRLRICSDMETCDGCPYIGRSNCSDLLMKYAAQIIDLLLAQ